MWSGNKIEAIAPVRTVYTFIRFSRGLNKVSGSWDEYEWRRSGDGLNVRGEGKGKIQDGTRVHA